MIRPIEPSIDRDATRTQSKPKPVTTCDGCGEFLEFCKCDDLEWFTPETRAMGYAPLPKEKRANRTVKK